MNDSITVITSSRDNSEKAGLPNFKKMRNEVQIKTDELASNLKDFLDKIKPVVEVQETKVGKFHITEIELSLAVTASGGIQLIGKTELGVEGGIKIKLTRKEEKNE